MKKLFFTMVALAMMSTFAIQAQSVKGQKAAPAPQADKVTKESAKSPSTSAHVVDKTTPKSVPATTPVKDHRDQTPVHSDKPVQPTLIR